MAAEGIPDQLAATVHQRRPGIDPAALIADGWAAAQRLLEQYIDAGLTKFVIRPAIASSGSGAALSEFLDRFAGELIPLQN